MSQPKLSILICSLRSRAKKLEALLTALKPQLNDQVECLQDIDGGEVTVGCKRNRLLHRAAAEFVCFIDDDDLISPHYVSGILEALQFNPDCVRIHGAIVSANSSFKPMLCTNQAGARSGTVLRQVGHLNPVRRELALKTGFADMSSGEDADYAHRLKKHLHTEAEADKNKTSYFYHYDQAKSSTRHQEYMYWNRIGGDFQFTLLVDIPGYYQPRAKLNNLLLEEPRLHHGKCILKFVHTAHNCTTSFLVNNMIAGSVIMTNNPTEVGVLPGGDMKLLRAIDAVINNQRTVLRYKRRV